MSKPISVVTYLDNLAAIRDNTNPQHCLDELDQHHQPTDRAQDTPMTTTLSTFSEQPTPLTSGEQTPVDGVANADLALSPAIRQRVQAWVQRGYALENLGHYEEAIISFERAIVLHARCVHAWQGRGIALAQLGYHEEALMSFGRVTRWQPDDYRGWQNMGRVLMHLARYAEALTYFDRALLLKVDSYKAWYHRAIALDALKKPMAALSSIDRALKIRPECHYAWTAQGLLLTKVGRYSDADASFDCSVRLRGNNFGAWYGKASCAALQGLVEIAIADLTQAMKCSPLSARSMLKTDPQFESIRGTLEFQRFLQSTLNHENGDVQNR
jgi:tetratricopeptide (TPR) repeat protein